jgi:hypothetical protein
MENEAANVWLCGIIGEWDRFGLECHNINYTAKDAKGAKENQNQNPPPVRRPQGRLRRGGTEKNQSQRKLAADFADER